MPATPKFNKFTIQCFFACMALGGEPPPLGTGILSEMAQESLRRCGKVAPVRGSPPRQKKIDHFVVLLMENRAFDNVLGCLDKPGLDGIANGHAVPVDPTDPSRGLINITCGQGEYMCKAAPSYDTFAMKRNGGEKLGGSFTIIFGNQTLPGCVPTIFCSRNTL